MQDDIKPQNIKMWTKYTHAKHMFHILIYIDDKLERIGIMRIECELTNSHERKRIVEANWIMRISRFEFDAH
jgi:hypothetical protein